MKHLVALALTLAALPAMAHEVHGSGHTHAPLFLIALLLVLAVAALVQRIARAR